MSYLQAISDALTLIIHEIQDLKSGSLCQKFPLSRTQIAFNLQLPGKTPKNRVQAALNLAPDYALLAYSTIAWAIEQICFKTCKKQEQDPHCSHVGSLGGS